MRAVDIGQRLAAANAMSGDLADAQARSPHGLFVVDADGRLRQANPTGQALLCGAGPLRLSAGRLTAAAPDIARRLEGLIRQATSDDPAARASGSLALRSPSHHAPLSVSVIPTSRQTHSMFDPSRSAIVCVTDPEARLSLSELTLRDLYGLTPAETRVAIALFEGDDPPAAAERLKLSVATVRTHLAHIFDKTEAHSQAELSRVLMRTLGAGIS
jgi:DNA-binding CsgD family transcriptional regulator